MTTAQTLTKLTTEVICKIDKLCAAHTFNRGELFGRLQPLFFELARFYKHHFIPQNPKDLKLIPISRTIGADRVVDELLVCFTHDIEIDWMLPGVAPTGKYVEIPLVAVVRFRGDKLYNEHIYWDQASVLVQLGLLNPAILPVAGIETAKKLIDESLPSNTLMKRWSESAPPE